MRLAVAREQGLDESTIADADDSGASLSVSQRAALALADAEMTMPGSLADDVVDALHAHFDDEQLLELTLDVMKWNYQKVAVALGTDDVVHPGELSDLRFDDHGNWVR